MGGTRTVARARAGVLALAVVLAVTAGLLTGCDPTTYTMTIKATPTGPMGVGTRVEITGKVSPARSGSKVVIERLIGGSWQRRAEGRLTASSTYAIPITPTERATYSLRARWLGPDGARAASQTLRIVVSDGPSRPPSPPSAVSAIVGDHAATVSWAAPATGSPVTSYRIVASPSGAQWTVPGSARTLDAWNLVNGMAYRFVVYALNDAGSSDGAVSNVVVPRGLPGTPSVSASVAGRTITWTWPEPSPNGAPILGYTVRLDGDLVEIDATARTFQRTFGAGESHTLTVVAFNEVGPSSAGSATATTLPDPATVTISKGSSAQGAEGCASSSCAFIAVTTEGLGSGSRQYTCHSSRESPWWGPSMASGTGFETACYYGFPDDQVWVVVDGVKSNEITW